MMRRRRAAATPAALALGLALVIAAPLLLRADAFFDRLGWLPMS